MRLVRLIRLSLVALFMALPLCKLAQRCQADNTRYSPHPVHRSHLPRHCSKTNPGAFAALSLGAASMRYLSAARPSIFPPAPRERFFAQCPDFRKTASPYEWFWPMFQHPGRANDLLVPLLFPQHGLWLPAEDQAALTFSW